MNGEKPRLDWTNILANAIATILAGTFIGAGIIVWNAAMDQKEFTKTMKSEMGASLELNKIQIEKMQATLTAEIGALRAALDAQRSDFGKFASSMTNRTGTVVSNTFGQPRLWQFPVSNQWEKFLVMGESNAGKIESKIQEQVQQQLQQQQQQQQQLQQLQQQQSKGWFGK